MKLKDRVWLIIRFSVILPFVLLGLALDLWKGTEFLDPDATDMEDWYPLDAREIQ